MLAKTLYFAALIFFSLRLRRLAWKLLAIVKRGGSSIQGADLLRARIALQHKGGSPGEAFQCTLEELRAYPDNAQAGRLRDQLFSQVFPKQRLGNAEFQKLYEQVFSYTMMSQERLHSLFLLARRCVEEGIPGDFVECGVAGGGGSAVLAYVAASDSKIKRKVYACDTFEGMPQPGEKDVSNGVAAEATGWGSGTCRGGQASLAAICGTLGVSDYLVPVLGLFEESLAGLSGKVDGIALLHADGDWYSSTIAIFSNLFDSVVEEGFIQIDDYGFWKGCAEAVHDFEASRGIYFELHEIDSTGRWLRKQSTNFPVPGLRLGPQCNLGCGTTLHRAWENYDFSPVVAGVKKIDLGKSLPLPTSTYEACYLSHVLEHLPRQRVPQLLAEIFAILRPSGVLRVVAPDLENIARLYLAELDVAAAGDQGAIQRHEWMTLELIDQMTRSFSGGFMGRTMRSRPLSHRDFIERRMGWEARRWLESNIGSMEEGSEAITPADIYRVPGKDDQEEATFRRSGEVHCWMYDRVSLRRILENCGYKDITVCRADESRIPNFARYRLDTDEAGVARKPDSLFMEATKPA